MFTSLRPASLDCIDDKQRNRSVRHAGDHRLQVVSVTWYVNDVEHSAISRGDVPKAEINRETPSPFFLESIGLDARHCPNES